MKKKKLNPYKALKLNRFIMEENHDFFSEGRWKEVYDQMMLDYPEFNKYGHLTSYELFALDKCYKRLKYIDKEIPTYVKDIQEVIRERRKNNPTLTEHPFLSIFVNETELWIQESIDKEKPVWVKYNSEKYKPLLQRLADEKE